MILISTAKKFMFPFIMSSNPAKGEWGDILVSVRIPLVSASMSASGRLVLVPTIFLEPIVKLASIYHCDKLKS